MIPNDHLHGRLPTTPPEPEPAPAPVTFMAEEIISPVTSPVEEAELEVMLAHVTSTSSERPVLVDSTAPLTYQQVTALFGRYTWVTLLVTGFVLGLAAAAPVADRGPLALAWLALAFPLPALFAIDWRTSRLPNVIVKPMVAVCASFSAVAAATGDVGLVALGAGAATGAGVYLAFYLLHLFSGGLGMGDVRLLGLVAFTVAVYSPAAAIVATVLAPPLLMIPATLAAVSRGRKAVPFGPAIVVATLMSMAAVDTISSIFVL